MSNSAEAAACQETSDLSNRGNPFHSWKTPLPTMQKPQCTMLQSLAAAAAALTAAQLRLSTFAAACADAKYIRDFPTWNWA